ncbi:MAG TPA: hypothetical protein VFL83_16150 [Anaeromyxobacter sp.]|nr:hypothetical protein [Anaeromyxobacter sp.]
MERRLEQCDAELRPLVPAEGSSALAREQARSFNDDVATVRAALLEPAKDLLAKGAPVRDLTACLEKSVAQLVFWRRVLLGMHDGALGPKPERCDYLLRWLTG